MDRTARPKLIIFRLGSIGDTVVALPCFHAVARRYPDHERILFANSPDSARASPVESVLEGSGLIHGAVHYPVHGGQARRALDLVARLRRIGARTLIYMAPRTSSLQVWRDVIFFRLAGIRTIVGAPFSADQRNCRIDSGSGELEYEAERTARALGIPVDLSPSNRCLSLLPAELTRAAELLAPLPPDFSAVAVSPGAKIPRKDWGEANWSTLLDLMQLRTPPVALVLIGAADERPLTERLAQRWRGPCINLCGALSPRETAAVLGRCGLLVCHDGGSMHLAASQGTPCVALFGDYNRPRQWYPYGEQHRVLHCGSGIAGISVGAVVQTIAAALAALPGAAQPPASGRERLRLVER
ncbi:MAG TPA: glycosyltransferase family 9 protein [Steroidobacteraceae bacterium]|nr:glycosyltransferase family 9 protein [Steroidobacteraceae bacterium]